jgi:hypothetical protein
MGLATGDRQLSEGDEYPGDHQAARTESQAADQEELQEKEKPLKI